MRPATCAIALALTVLTTTSLHGEDDKEKALARALDDLEKEVRGRKEEPAPALELLVHFAGKVGLPAKDALALVKEVHARKIPPMTALATSLEREQETDPKKWTANFKKWVAGWTSPTPGGAFHVSPQGKDDGDGSRDNPWKTLEHAVKTAPAGSVLLLRGGTYSEAVRCDKPLAFRAYQKETPRIVAPGGKTAVFDLEAKATGSQLVGLEIEGATNGIYLESQGSGKNGWTACTDVLVERCRIHGCSLNAIELHEGCDRCIVSHCELWDAKGTGLRCIDASFVILQDSRVHDVTVGAFLDGGVVRAILERNLIEDVDEGLGLGCGLPGTGTLFSEFTLARQPGNVLYEALDCVARNNVIARTKGAAIMAMAALRPRIENNTILDAASLHEAGILLCGADHKDAQPPYPKEPQKTKDASVVNNIVVASAANPAVSLSKDTQGPRFANNCYFGAKGAPVLVDEALEKPLNGSFEDWRAQTGETGSVAQDPALQPDHVPGPASPCLHAGQAVAGFVDDFSGHRRKAWDMGALAPPEPKK